MADAPKSEPKDLRFGFVKILGRLEQLMRAKGEVFRAQAYKKAQEELLGSTTPITSAEQLRHRPGIGATMIKKFEEYSKTGKLQALEKPGDQALLDLTAVHGIGPKKAKELIGKGITTIAQLRTAVEANPKELNARQKLALQHHEELQERIPRSEIEEFEQELLKVWDSVVPAKNPVDKMMIVGSYRRGASDSGDIDIIITGTHAGIHKRFVDALKSSGLLTGILSTGKTKTLAIGRLSGGKHRRVDIMYSPPDEYPFAVLYFTGSRSFNVAMRNRALGLGYSLSEHGLIDTATKGKVTQPMKTEEDIFRFLGMQFREPQARTGVLAVVATEGAAPVAREKVRAKKTAKKTAAAAATVTKRKASPPAKPATPPKSSTPKPPASGTPKSPTPKKKPLRVTLHATPAAAAAAAKARKTPRVTLHATPTAAAAAAKARKTATPKPTPKKITKKSGSTPRSPKPTAKTPIMVTTTPGVPPTPIELLSPPSASSTPSTATLRDRFRQDLRTAAARFEPPLTVGQSLQLSAATTAPSPFAPPPPPPPSPTMLPPSPIPLASLSPVPASPAPASQRRRATPPPPTPSPRPPSPRPGLTTPASKTKSPTSTPTPKPRSSLTAKKKTPPKRKTVRFVVPRKSPATKTIRKQTVQRAKRPTMKANLASCSASGVDALLAMDQKALESMYRKANKTYREGEPIMTDNAFDILEEHIRERFPQSKVLQVVGAKTKRVEVPLPYTLFSMNKVRPGEGKLAKWKAKYRGPYAISAKLDGASALYVLKKDGGAGLYTHGEIRKGDTTQKGGDVTHLVPVMGMATQLPPSIPDTIMVRGEVILRKELFDKKYSGDYANPRNLAAGLLNATDTAKHGDRQKDLEFVAFEVIEPKGLTPTEQFRFLEQHEKALGIEVVGNKIIAKPEELTEERLSAEFTELREKHPYECDGVIVVDDKVYPRKNQNPDHAIAFKMTLTDEIVTATVRTISWNVSKDGYIKPTVHLHPVQVPGALVSKATGHDARALQRKKIGPGATIEVIRRGQVIPHIERVLTPATETNVQEGWWDGPYEWDGANIRLPPEAMKDDQWNTEVRLTNMQRFFSMIKAKGLGDKTVAKLFEEGYDTIPKIAMATPQELTRIEGIQATSAKNIVESVKKALAEAPLIKLVVGSNVFGRGTGHTIMGDALTKYPHLLHFASDDAADVRRLTAGLASIKGISEGRARQIIAALPEFRHFMEHLRPDLVRPWPADKALAAPDPAAAKGPSPVVKGHPLAGKEIITTGVKHKLVEPHLDRVGAKLGSRVNANTAVVIVRDEPGYSSTKTKEAEKRGIPQMTVEQFMAQHFPGAK